MVYGATGITTIFDHFQPKSQVEKYILKKSLSLPAQSTSSSTYGLHPIYEQFMLPEKKLRVNSNIPLSDRITHKEGMVLPFIAEYSLPYSSARNIVELAKEMMRNPKAANKLKVARQTASYKMWHGLAKGLQKQLKDKVREGFLSFIIDEATSSNLHKVLILLISYFCSTKNQVVVEHLVSLNLSVFEAVLDLINEKNCLGTT